MCFSRLFIFKLAILKPFKLFRVHRGENKSGLPSFVVLRSHLLLVNNYFLPLALCPSIDISLIKSSSKCSRCGAEI